MNVDELIEANAIHNYMVWNDHKVSAALNEWRVPTFQEVLTTIQKLKAKSMETGNDVITGGITVHHDGGKLRVSYRFEDYKDDL